MLQDPQIRVLQGPVPLLAPPHAQPRLNAPQAQHRQQYALATTPLLLGPGQIHPGAAGPVFLGMPWAPAPSRATVPGFGLSGSSTASAPGHTGTDPGGETAAKATCTQQLPPSKRARLEMAADENSAALLVQQKASSHNNAVLCSAAYSSCSGWERNHTARTGGWQRCVRAGRQRHSMRSSWRSPEKHGLRFARLCRYRGGCSDKDAGGPRGGQAAS